MPPGHEGGLLLGAMHRGRAMRWGADPSVYDAQAVLRTIERVGPLFGPRRYFRLDARGLDTLPPPPVMLVSNHSGGTSIPDAWGFAVAWYRRFGATRPLHLLAHELILGTETTGRYFATRGVLRASDGVARDVLSRYGRDLLVMPGGELDTWRPWWRRYQVEFAGRTGYARMALELGVPIVPVAHAGAHDTLLVLSDGRALAHAMHLQRLVRAEIWPVHLSLPWGLAVGPLPHIPVPARLRYRLGDAIRPSPSATPPTHDDAIALDEQVRAAVQAMLDELRDE